MTMRKWLHAAALAGGVLLMGQTAQAQTAVTGTSGVTFVSTDQNTIIPAGQLNAGQPLLSSYQAMLFPSAADVTSGVPTTVGPVLSKTLAALQPSPANTYKLTFAQMGVLPPACTALPCATYTVLLVAIGPGGTSARAVAAESDPFTAVVPVPPPAPAGPTSVKVVP